MIDLSSCEISFRKPKKKKLIKQRSNSGYNYYDYTKSFEVFELEPTKTDRQSSQQFQPKRTKQKKSRHGKMDQNSLGLKHSAKTIQAKRRLIAFREKLTLY